MATLSVFCAYSRKDEALLGELREHLAPLRREKRITVWHDREIVPGEDWEKAIDEQLEAADIILLLVSASFFDSEYCYGREMNRAMERDANGSARAIPIIVRSVDWHRSPLGPLQALPRDGKAVTTWADRDLAWTDVATGIRRVIDELSSATQLSQDNTTVEKGSRRPIDASETLPTYGRKADPMRPPPPADLLWRVVNESPAGLRQRRACLNLLGVGWSTKGDRWMDANLRVQNEGEHEALDVHLFVRPKGEDWRPGGGAQVIAPRQERQLTFPFRHGEQGDTPIQERHEFDIRLQYRDGSKVDNEIEYTVLFLGPGRDWRVTVHRQS